MQHSGQRQAADAGHVPPPRPEPGDDVEADEQDPVQVDDVVRVRDRGPRERGEQDVAPAWRGEAARRVVERHRQQAQRDRLRDRAAGVQVGEQVRGHQKQQPRPDRRPPVPRHPQGAAVGEQRASTSADQDRPLQRLIGIDAGEQVEQAGDRERAVAVELEERVSRAEVLEGQDADRELPLAQRPPRLDDAGRHRPDLTVLDDVPPRQRPHLHLDGDQVKQQRPQERAARQPAGEQPPRMPPRGRRESRRAAGAAGRAGGLTVGRFFTCGRLDERPFPDHATAPPPGRSAPCTSIRFPSGSAVKKRSIPRILYFRSQSTCPPDCSTCPRGRVDVLHPQAEVPPAAGRAPGAPAGGSPAPPRPAPPGTTPRGSQSSPAAALPAAGARPRKTAAPGPRR